MRLGSIFREVRLIGCFGSPNVDLRVDDNHGLGLLILKLGRVKRCLTDSRLARGRQEVGLVFKSAAILKS